ncbi:unnamed protein product [Cunninghamella blakesleeana]
MVMVHHQNHQKTLSPRQMANKAITLANKKLNQDEIRRKPKYYVRERLLIQHTMQSANHLLSSRNNNHSSDQRRQVLLMSPYDW